MTISITRTEHSAADLRRQAAGMSDAAVVRRLLALALILDRQTLRDWAHRYNADGVPGLSNRHAGGVKPRLSPPQQADVARWMREGPDIETDGVVRWRCVDIQERIERVLRVRLHERSVGKLLRRLGFSHISARPRHPKADAAAQASFRPGSPLL